MKKSRVVVSRKARTSLKEYIKYLKQEISAEVATHVKEGIINKCKGLKDFSGYSKEPYLKDEPLEYRSVSIIWSYKIIYRITEKEVRILNIVHTGKHPNNIKDI